MANALSPPAKGAAAAQVEEREEEEPPEQDGWLEVGRRNRMVVTRTVSYWISVFVVGQGLTRLSRVDKDGGVTYNENVRG